MRGLFHSIFILKTFYIYIHTYTPLEIFPGDPMFISNFLKPLYICTILEPYVNRWGQEGVVIHLESLRKTFPIEPWEVLIPFPSPILEVLAFSPQLTSFANVANGLEGYFAGTLKIFSNTPCLSIPHINTCIGSSCIIYRCIFKRILYFWDLTLFSLRFNSYQLFYMITWQTIMLCNFFYLYVQHSSPTVPL